MLSKTALAALLIAINLNVYSQNSRIISDYITLKGALTDIKTQTEDLSKDIKKEWSNVSVNKPSSNRNGKEGEKSTSSDSAGKDSIKTNVDSMNSKPAADSPKTKTTDTSTVPVQKPKPERIVLVKDSLLTASKLAYLEIRGAVAGLVAQFGVIIMQPRALNDNIRRKIDSSIARLNTCLQNFKLNYAKGSQLLSSGVAMSPSSLTGIIDFIEKTVSIYRKLRQITADARASVIESLKKECALREWEAL